MSLDFSEYPICDTDMWVNICLGDLASRIFEKYGKIVFADVVEKEILEWEKNEKFAWIASYFRRCKEDGLITVIYHDEHLDEEEREFLEGILRDLNFKYGFRDQPHEKNKGEFVSAIYADHFGLPFMKTNDGAFQEGGDGKKDFPDLKIKNWYDIVEEFAVDFDEKVQIRNQVAEARKRMNYHYEQVKTEKKKEELLLKLQEKFNKNRL